MLAKDKKISAGKFYKLQAQSITFKDKLLYYQAKKVTNQSNAKIIILTPKKVIKLSTQRNRARRIISEAVKTIYPNIKKEAVIAIKTHGLLEKETSRSLTPLINDAFKQMNLIS